MTEQSKQVCSLLQAAQKDWNPPTLPQKAADMPQGDMPGDAVHISEAHRTKADAIFPLLLPQLAEICARNPYGRAVITVCGGSGSGKTGAAALLGYYFKQIGIGSYVLSGDNYPRRYPALNDAERLRIFRQGGMHGLTNGALLNPDVWQQLHTWQIEQRDADPTLCADVPWLAVYQAEGRKALAGYLGTPSEQDFDELGQTLARFKNGIDAIWLKRMGRDEAALWYDKVDFSQVKVLIVEWTHGKSHRERIVTIPMGIWELLMALRQQQVLHSGVPDREQPIFTDPDGHVPHPDAFTRHLRKLYRQCGLPEDYHLHTLRHFYATYLLQEGTSKQVAASLLGHADTAFLERTYCHPQDVAKQQAAKLMQDLLNNQNPCYVAFMKNKNRKPKKAG